jgi:hypothetical protein
MGGDFGEIFVRKFGVIDCYGGMRSMNHEGLQLLVLEGTVMSEEKVFAERLLAVPLGIPFDGSRRTQGSTLGPAFRRIFDPHTHIPTRHHLFYWTVVA